MSRERTDDELMVALRCGDDGAFCEIVDRWQGPLQGFFHRHLRDRQLSEDLSQDTLLKIHANAGSYVPCGTFKAWLYRLARNRLIDQARKRKHDVIVQSIRSRKRDDDRGDPLDRMSRESDCPYTAAEAKEAVAVVMSVVDRLSIDDDDVATQCLTLLEYADGESYPEIAERRRIPLATVKSQSRLAREKLRERLLCKFA